MRDLLFARAVQHILQFNTIKLNYIVSDVLINVQINNFFIQKFAHKSSVNGKRLLKTNGFRFEGDV